MAHPRMYDDTDPLLARVRTLCARLPGSVEKEAWGRPTFRAPTRIYAVYGASLDRQHGLVFKPDDDERPALVADPRFFSPPYFGPSGWLALDLTPDSDWVEVAELLESSFREVASGALLRELDQADTAAADRDAADR